MSDRSRIQLELTLAMQRKLDALVSASGLISKADVIRRALTVFAVLLEEESKGGSIEIACSDGQRKKIIL